MARKLTSKGLETFSSCLLYTCETVCHDNGHSQVKLHRPWHKPFISLARQRNLAVVHLCKLTLTELPTPRTCSPRLITSHCQGRALSPSLTWGAVRGRNARVSQQNQALVSQGGTPWSCRTAGHNGGGNHGEPRQQRDSLGYTCV